MDKVLDFGKHDGEKLGEVPTSYVKWLATHANVLKVENRHFSLAAKALLERKEKKVEKQPTTLQFTVRPWGCQQEWVKTSGMARFADKDSRLKVEKSVQGKWGKANTAIVYKIIVPADYPDQISIAAKHGRDSIRHDDTIIYSPDGKVDQLLPRNQY